MYADKSSQSLSERVSNFCIGYKSKLMKSFGSCKNNFLYAICSLIKSWHISDCSGDKKLLNDVVHKRRWLKDILVHES